MVIKTRSSPFGGVGRTRVLLALRMLSESYPRELARVLGMPFSSVLQALRSLEMDGLVAGRALGRTRVFKIDPRYFAYDELPRRPPPRPPPPGAPCPSLHSGGAYSSVDMDFILLGDVAQAALDAAMRSVGF